MPDQLMSRKREMGAGQRFPCNGLDKRGLSQKVGERAANKKKEDSGSIAP